jgi:hypothetical protein
MSKRSISSRAFEALGRVTWKLARRKATDTVKNHTAGATGHTRTTGARTSEPKTEIGPEPKR